MQNSVITNNSYLGPYHHSNKLQVGDTQKMIFNHTDKGPFYLSEKERRSLRFDSIIGNKTENIPKPDLIKRLKDKGIKNPKGNKDKLKKLCDKSNIPTKHTILDIKQGWTNKLKGAYQVLWEQWWINPNVPPKTYIWKGKTDEYSDINEFTSIKIMIMNQPDFLEQKTLLQHHCKKLSVFSDQSPVAHCEIAGEGIEFDWGFSKMSYCSKPIEMKRNKTKFHKLVMSVLSRDVLTVAVCRANTHRARQYMLAYMALTETANNQSYPNSDQTTNKQTQQHSDDNQHQQQTTDINRKGITHSLIEKAVWVYFKSDKRIEM